MVFRSLDRTGVKGNAVFALFEIRGLPNVHVRDCVRCTKQLMEII